MIRTFRKKPIEIEAVQLTRENGPAVWEWADSKPWYGSDGQVHGLSIYTSYGRLKAEFGDWIVKDPDGRFRPIKPEVFASVYELVEGLDRAHCPRCHGEEDGPCEAAAGGHGAFNCPGCVTDGTVPGGAL